MAYPYHAVPDGAPFGPHHLYIGLLVTGFAFATVWPYYPQVGATGTLLGLLIALDDAVSHAFGVTTPLDFVWVNYLLPHMS